ncbi:SDR family NAD(P)-dependent oxidoreductase [Limnobacter humi]|uniref:SDR family NAD(P)-dependent oxidoreductase n=1 Tax=Limnobacter humi TaxID=1778671 RepID=A0ABT1WBM1_9BURK|nr:SDR family NAD(P)-dependent oxidoreductase [Limnobacter humi]MCQ8894917.1 SDR family NAD(P)-dependent oxidoreductase [Limnobacter humi]
MALNRPITDWKGKRVWLVGASTGIGEALARQLDAQGCQQVLSARSADKLAALAKDLNQAMAVPVDIADEHAVEQAARVALQYLEGIDLVVLMAGTYAEMAIENFDLTEVKRQVNVNLNGTLHVLAQVLPVVMQQRAGHIAVVSSVAGYRGLPNSLAYGPTKAALINLAEALYVELKPHGVGVSLINPGFVDTPLTRKNTFPMPFIIGADKAASEIIYGLEAGEFETHFPKTFTRSLRAMRLMPYSLYFSAVKRFAKTQPPGTD